MIEMKKEDGEKIYRMQCGRGYCEEIRRKQSIANLTSRWWCLLWDHLFELSYLTYSSGHRSVLHLDIRIVQIGKRSGDCWTSLLLCP